MNANVGMQYMVAATVGTYTPGTSIQYATGSNFAEAVSASLSWDRADGHFYGDDVEPAGLSDAARGTLLGETVSSSEYTITDSAAPDVGFGYVRVMRNKGVVSYEAWWFYKVKFGVTSEETRTKERSIEWRVPTLEGTGTGVSLDSSGKLYFADHRTFTALADAKTWLKAKAGIT